MNSRNGSQMNSRNGSQMNSRINSRNGSPKNEIKNEKCCNPIRNNIPRQKTY